MGIDFVKESSAIVFVEDTSEAPWLLLEGLHVLDLDHKDIARLGVLDLKRPAQVVDFGQVDVLHVICAVVVPNLATSPIHAFNLYDFSIFDLLRKWYCRRGQCWISSL